MIRKVEEIVNFGAGIANVPLEALADGDQPHVAILLALYDGGDMLGDQLDSIAGLGKLVDTHIEADLSESERYLYMELALQGLTEYEVLHKDVLENSLSFRDILADMLGDEDDYDYE